jgi:hypothetical protein
MKFADLKVGTTYGVIPAWDYSSSDKKNPETVRRTHVAKAELVSLDKYEYVVYRSDSAVDSNFKPAPKGSRTVGYLVKSSDWANSTGTQGDIYWLARPQDIVAIYSTLETGWVEKERIEKEQELKMKQEREERERKERAVYERQTALSNSCMSGLKAILGDRAGNVKAEISNRRNSNGDYAPVAHFELDVITMQILIEKVLEAQEAVA